jgi:MFS family permease
MTDSQKLLSKKYITYRIFTNMWFMGAIWLYFYRIFINDHQVGILDGLAFAIGLLAEVPSGALADKFGRARMVRLGHLLIGAGLLIQAFGSSFAPFFIGQAVTMIGIAFVSGADEALFFERLNFTRQSSHWRRLIMRGSQVALIGSLFATVAGGWLHTINPRIPWIITGLSFLIAALLIWSIKDPHPKKARQNLVGEIKSYINDIKIGFAQFRLPKLWLYVPIIIAVQGLFYATGYGLLRLILLDRFHFDPLWGSIVVGASSLITVGVLALMHKYADNVSEKQMVTFISLSAAAGLLLSLANIGAWGFVVILVLYIGEHALHPFMSEVLNTHAPEQQRATVLSVASFLKALPYVCLAPLIGYLNTQSQLHYFLISWSVVILAVTLLYLIVNKKDAHIKIQSENPPNLP